MDQQAFVYLLPYLLSVAISLGTAVICWLRQSIPGARAYALVALLQGLATIGFILELISSTLDLKIIWDNAQWLPDMLVPVAFLAFAEHYLGRKQKYPRRLFALLSIFPVIITVFAYTNELHLLVRPDAYLRPGIPFDELTYRFTPLVLLAGLHIYICYFVGIALLIHRFFRVQGLYRRQIGAIVLGNLIAVLGSIVVLAGVQITFHRDTTPFTFAVGNVIVMWSLLRYRLFDVMPVAYDALFNSMPDLVFVVDRQNRLIDLNPAAKSILPQNGAASIGKSLAEVFPNRLDLIERFGDVTLLNAELALETPTGNALIDLRISPILDVSGKLNGRLIIGRDITASNVAQQAEKEQRLLAEALIDVAQALTSTLDLNEVLDRILVNLESVVPHDRAEILLVRGSTTYLAGARNTSKSSYEEGLGVYGIFQNEPLLHQMFETQQINRIASVKKDPREFTGAFWIQSFLGAPIIADGQVLGFINLGIDKDNFFSKTHAQRLHAFADQAAIAIHNANLYQINTENAEQALRQTSGDLARSNAFIESLAEVGRRLESTLDLNLILETIGTKLKTFGIEAVINLLESDLKTLVVRYSTVEAEVSTAIHKSLGGVISDYPTFLIPDEAGNLEDLERRRKLFETDPVQYVLTETMFAKLPRQAALELIEHIGIRSGGVTFYFPLLVADQVVGTMSVWGSGLHRTDAPALSAFAGQVANAIRNARLYQAERNQREFAEALTEIAAVLNNTLSLNEVLDRILDCAAKVVPHDSANIMLIENGMAHVVGKRGYKQRNLDTDVSRSKWAIDDLYDFRYMHQNKLPMIIPNTHNDPNWVVVPGYEWIRSAAGAPIVVGNDVIGFLNLESTKPGFFSEKDALRLQAFAQQASIAINNANRYQAEHEQRLLEEALRQGEERFRLVIENMPILLDAFDKDGKVVAWNKACETATGYTAEEVFGHPNIMELLYPDPDYRAMIWQVSSDPETKDTTFDLTSKSGDRRSIHWFETYHLFEIPGWAAWGMGLDITEQKRAQEAERKQRQLAEALRDTASVLNSTLSLSEVLDRILESIVQVLPHDAANIMLIENGVAEVVRKRGYTQRGLDRTIELARWNVKDIPTMQSMTENRKPVAIPDTGKHPNWVPRSDSSWIRSLAGAPIRWGDTVIGFLNLDSATPGFFSEEDAERLQAFADQAALGIHNARLYEAEHRERVLAQTLQKTAAALIRTLDTQDTLTVIMDQLAEVVPYDHALLMTVEDSELHPIASRGLPIEGVTRGGIFNYANGNLPRSILSEAGSLNLADIHQYPDGINLPGVQENTRSWMAIPLITWGVVIGVLIVGSTEIGRFDDRTQHAATAFAQQAAVALENVRMMTELSQMVFNLREAQARLSRSARLAAAGEIAAGVAHQINNPLTAIIAEVSLMLRDLAPDDPNYESALAIREAAELAGNVVQRQLNLSRSVPYEMELTDINASLRSASSLIRAQIEPIARLNLSLAENLPPVMASTNHLSDIWLNLMLNAKDALTGSVNAEINVETFLIDGNSIQITIQDNGQGIPQENLERIFDPFFTTKVRGHGLGLSIVYEVIRRHNGSIHVESKEGFGTTIKIMLPVSDSQVNIGSGS